MRLTLTEKSVLEPGYRRAYTPARDETVSAPRLAEKKRGDRVNVQTRAAKRAGLSEADLVRLMRQIGVGRPSTYAATLEALRRHGYIETKDDRLVVTRRGRAALAFLEKNHLFLLALDFSAEIEAALDDLASGRGAYVQIVQGVWERLK